MLIKTIFSIFIHCQQDLENRYFAKKKLHMQMHTTFSPPPQEVKKINSTCLIISVEMKFSDYIRLEARSI